MHAENYVTLRKEGRKEGREGRKKNLNKWRDILYSRTGRLNTVKMSILPKLIYRFNKISIKIPAISFIDTDKITLKFI